MIDIEEARRMAVEWVHGADPAAEAGVFEFELGYVIWRIDDRPLAEREIGAPCAVIGRDTGELSLWPSLAASRVAELYRVHLAAQQRFPADVQATLRLGGWRPGRDVSAIVDSWWTGTGSVSSLPAAARAALSEFGGLRMRVLGWTFVPQRPDEAARFHRELSRERQQPVLVIADLPDGSLAVDDTGRTYLVRATGVELVTDTFEQMVNSLLGDLGGR